MLEENKEIVRRYSQLILTEQQYDRLDEFLKPDFIDHRGSVPITGADELRRQMEMIHRGFADMDFQIVHLVASDETVAVHFQVPCVHSGGFAGIDRSGQAVVWKGIMIYEIKDGKLAQGWGYWNDAEIVSSLQP